MASLKYLTISNYRSIGAELTLRLPDDAPLVLVGPNNAGKSNIARATDLVLGERWPGTHEPEDHEFHNRDRENTPITITVDFDGLDYVRAWDGQSEPADSLVWMHDTGETRFSVNLAAGGSRQVSNPTRSQCVAVYIAADRRLSYQLSYVSKFTLLSRLMRRFHDALVSQDARKTRLQEKFGEIKSIFEEVAEFSEFSVKLKEELDSFSADLEYGLEVDFSAYDPSNYFHALHVQPLQDGEARSFDELGTGQEQLLAFSLVQAYAEAFHGEGGLLLVVEEPEAHLHPMAQRWLAERMKSLVEAGVQVIVTTHSPAFIDLMGADGIAVVRKTDGTTRVTQLRRDQLAHYCKRYGARGVTPDNVLPFYAAAATDEILSGLFARKVVLVEGPTEALALPIYCRKAGLTLAREGITVIPVHGVGNLAKWWRFFTAYGIATYAIFDNDARDDGQGAKRRDLLATLGVDDHVADDLVTTAEWRTGSKCSVFGRDFETSLRSIFGEPYQALEEEAAQQGLGGQQSKPLAARYVAEHIEIPEGSVAYGRFAELNERIRELPLPNTSRDGAGPQA